MRKTADAKTAHSEVVLVRMFCSSPGNVAEERTMARQLIDSDLPKSHPLELCFAGSAGAGGDRRGRPVGADSDAGSGNATGVGECRAAAGQREIAGPGH